MFVSEGAEVNWDGAISTMNAENTNANIQFFRIMGHDHFSVIRPVMEILAKQVAQGNVSISTQSLWMCVNGVSLSLQETPNGRLNHPAVYFCIPRDEASSFE